MKADLFSTAILAGADTFLIDPIELEGGPLQIASSLTGILVTNANHLRAAETFAARFSAPILADPSAEIPSSAAFNSHPTLGEALTILRIEGAAPGEIAIFSERHDVLIVGDALINFGSHGFTLLPAKYCANPKQMRKSLRQLLDLKFERMLFAHGTPIMSKAHDRLAALLAETS